MNSPRAASAYASSSLCSRTAPTSVRIAARRRAGRPSCGAEPRAVDEAVRLDIVAPGSRANRLRDEVVGGTAIEVATFLDDSSSPAWVCVPTHVRTANAADRHAEAAGCACE